MKDFIHENILKNGDPVFIKIYNKRKRKYIKYARKLEYFLRHDKNEAIEISKVIDRMFGHFVENYNINDNQNNAKNIFHIYFVACFWIIHKYCHDDHISGEDLSRITRIHIKDICKAELELLFLYKFNIRKWLFYDM